MNDALGDSLAVEVTDLHGEVVVLERRGAPVAVGALVLGVVDRWALTRGEGLLLVFHEALL